MLKRRFVVADGYCLSGDRSGNLLLWDLQGSAGASANLKGHRGHITALAAPSALSGSATAKSTPTSNLLASAAQDGTIRKTINS